MRASHTIAWVATLLLTACLSGTDRRDPPAPAHASYRAIERSVDIDGQAIGPLPDDKRATVAIVFATWCGPCRRELAVLQALGTDRPDVRLVGINAYEEYADKSDVDRMRAYVAEHADGLRVVRADARVLSAFGGVGKIPSVFVYDATGALVEEFRRSQTLPPTRDDLHQALARADAARD